MKLSLIVPSNRSPERVLPLLKSLEKQRLRESDRGNFELIWVINGLPFATCQQLLAQISDPQFRSQVHLLYRPSANANEARNLGAEAAQGENLWFLDDDLELTTPFLLQKVLDKCVDKTAKYALQWAMGGNYLLGESTPEGKDYFHISQGFTQVVSSNDAAFLLGGFFILPKKLFEKLGGFDQSRVWGGAELELNRKLRSKNIPCERVEEWTLLHHLEISRSQLIRKAIAQGEGARPYPDFRSGFGAGTYYRLNWNVRRYMAAFHIGLEDPGSKRRFYRRHPWFLDISMSLHLFFWRVVDRFPIVEYTTRGAWKTLWHVLHLKNLGRDQRLRHTEVEFHRLSKKIDRNLDRVRKRYSFFLFFREMKRMKEV